MGGLTGNATALRVTVAILVLLAFVPMLHNGYYENLFRGVLMFATLSFGWNILGGYTGYVSFRKPVSFFRHRYVYDGPRFWQHWHQQSIPLAIGIAVILAVAFAVVLGIPILRLRGHYFAIATLGIALATEEIVANIDWLGAGSGQAIRPLESFSSYYVAMWIVCEASMLATYLISRSKLGYALVAIRGKTRKPRPCSGSTQRATRSSRGRSAPQWRRRPARCSPARTASSTRRPPSRRTITSSRS